MILNQYNATNLIFSLNRIRLGDLQISTRFRFSTHNSYSEKSRNMKMLILIQDMNLTWLMKDLLARVKRTPVGEDGAKKYKHKKTYESQTI